MAAQAFSRELIPLFPQAGGAQNVVLPEAVFIGPRTIRKFRNGCVCPACASDGWYLPIQPSSALRGGVHGEGFIENPSRGFEVVSCSRIYLQGYKSIGRFWMTRETHEFSCFGILQNSETKIFNIVLL